MFIFDFFFFFLNNNLVPLAALFLAVIPETGMSGWPLELVFLPKVKSECVAPGVDLITDVTLVFGHPLKLVIFEKKKKKNIIQQA